MIYVKNRPQNDRVPLILQLASLFFWIQHTSKSFYTKFGAFRRKWRSLLLLSHICYTTTSLPYGGCKGGVRLPQGRREAAVRFFRHPRQGKNCMKPHGHRKATVQPPYGDLAVWLGRCGIAVPERKFNVKLKKTQGLRWPCGVLKTVRSPYGLHKNRKAAVRFGGLRSPCGRRKHAANYTWPLHKRKYVLESAHRPII